MEPNERLLLWIDSELERLGCTEVFVRRVHETREAEFERGDASIHCRAEAAHARLLRLRSYAGDDAVWQTLQECAP